MKAIVIKRLNRRVGSPSVNAQKLTPLEPGTSIEITETLTGDEVDGNDTWYRSTEGWYVWSGGVETIEASAHDPGNKKEFDLLDSDTKVEVIARYIEQSGQKFIEKYPEITGFSFGNRMKKNQTINEKCIIVQVAKKEKSPSHKIPKYITFEGYDIAIDIQEFDETKSTGIDLSASVSQPQTINFGTIGLPVTKNESDYMLGCYHVYFSNELNEGEREVSKSDKVLLSPKFQQGQAENPLGKLVEGKLTGWLDIAICKPNDDVTIEYKNRVADSLRKAPRLVSDFEGRFLNFFGARSNKAITGRILSIFASQNISYRINNQYQKVLIHGLVQMEKPALGGDSGSVVVDSMDRVIGIVIASDNKSSYILSAENIERRTDYKIKYSSL